MVPRRGVARVTIPTAFYKIITFRRDDGSLSTLALIVPHAAVHNSGRQRGAYFQQHIVPVAEIKRPTGIDFFPGTTELGEEHEFCGFAGGATHALCGS